MQAHRAPRDALVRLTRGRLGAASRVGPCDARTRRWRAHGARPVLRRADLPAHRPTRSAGRRSASSPRPSARTTRVHRTPRPPRRGHPDVIAPPTFAFAITQGRGRRCVADPELGLDYSRVVHGDQKFAYTRPVRAGDRLVCEATITIITARAGNDLLTTTSTSPPSSARSCHRHVDAGGCGVSLAADSIASPAPTWSATPALPATSTRSTGPIASPPRSGCPTSSPTACSPWRSPAARSPAGSPVTRPRSLVHHPLRPSDRRPRRRQRRRTHRYRRYQAARG